MAKALDLTGKRFDKLVCVADVGLDRHGSRLWLCLCDCGNHVTKRAGVLTAEHQRRMACHRCGKEAMRRAHLKHGDATARRGIYGTWANMRNRCRNNTPKNRYWAGKGITVCAEWHEYAAFKAWALGAGYQPGLVIDRVNSDGNYEPSNCRWVTPSENTVYSLRDRWGK